jgi:hypothetical protein
VSTSVDGSDSDSGCTDTSPDSGWVEIQAIGLWSLEGFACEA